MANQANILLVWAILISSFTANAIGQEVQESTPQAAIDAELAATVQNARSLLTQQDGQLQGDADFENIKDDPRFIKLMPRMLADDDLFVEKTRILQQWIGEAAGDQFGWTARKAGDIDGDKKIDVITTAPTHANGSGKVYVYSSASGKLLHSVTGKPGERLGNSAVGIGDINADGVPDFAAGAPTPNAIGSVYVYSGKDASLIHTLTGKTVAGQFGYEVSEIGDFDGDGCPDLFVGAMAGDGAEKKSGRAEVVSGKTGEMIFELLGERAGDGFGNAAAAAEVEPGQFLLAIGAQNAGPSTHGRVYVYQVKNAKPELKFRIEGDEHSVNLGQMFISFPGDLNGDGVPDVYASDFSDNTRAKGGGKVVVHSGADGKQLLVIHGSQAGEGLGTSPSDAGDVDGDGIGDLVIGAWQNKQGAPSGGKVYLYSCAGDGKLLRTWTCKQAGDTLGFDATGIGDIDGDGHIDFLLTSAWSNKNGPKSGRVLIVAGEEHSADATTEDVKQPTSAGKKRSTRIGGLTQKKIESADVSALFIGNSHTWNLHTTIERLFAEAHPDKKVCIARAPGNGFLVDHARDKKTRDLIELGPWDYVILQAQKYSTTGRYSYPYDGALELSKLAQEQGSKIIMFPEWSQRGKPGEHLRINKIHHEIAAQTGAIVAPIGDCWDAVLKTAPNANLYAGDGNHASPLGAYLNACVFYSLLASEEAPPPKKSGDDALINLIRQTAWKKVASSRLVDGIYLVHRWTETKADLFPLQADEQYFLYDENKFFQLQDEEREPLKHIGLSKTEFIPFQLKSKPESIRQPDGRLEIGLEFSPDIANTANIVFAKIPGSASRRW